MRLSDSYLKATSSIPAWRHVAQPSRCAIGLLASLFVGLSGNGVLANNGPTQTAEVCATYFQLSAELRTDLTALGWSPMTSTELSTFTSVLRDGVMVAMPENPAEKIDFAKTEIEAGKLSATVAAAFEGGFARLALYFSNETLPAILAIVETKTPNVNEIQCIYSGPIDAQLTRMMDGALRMDATSGTLPPSPYYQIMQIQILENDIFVDQQVARYLPGIEQEIKRPLAVEMGFSQFSTRSKR